MGVCLILFSVEAQNPRMGNRDEFKPKTWTVTCRLLLIHTAPATDGLSCFQLIFFQLITVCPTLIIEMFSNTYTVGINHKVKFFLL